ncbi:2-oxoglutarate and iron-dependent oxygenase domain-containing protein [Rhodococcus sp. MALMAid1271]|uniref:isopenicillin N synthase family dioxygenase n=1 Tax=unclassified Rhodococcus (in: high G+C Gram-positive bacteria) TaxID=192944 RepID=UPI0030F5C42C
MLSIPPVDLSEISLGSRARARQIELLDTACARRGHAYLVGHGIPTALLTELYSVSRQFFLLPDSTKSAVAQPAPEQVRGWSGLGSEGMSYSLGEESHGDLKEKMDIGPVDAPVLGEAGAGSMAYPNLWPTLPTGFRPVWEQYYRHMQRIGDALMSLTAELFGLSADHFVGDFDTELSMLRALYYPAQPEPPMPHQSRAGIHTDYGAFTVTSGESTPGGLEILGRHGEWHEVMTTPATLVVLVGDLLAEWTDDHWPATLNRTVNPHRSLALDSSRLEFSFYQHPNADVAVSPLLGGEQQSNDALIAGRHLTDKYLRQTTFGRRPRR